MPRTISVSEARSTLPDLIDRIVDGDEVTLTRHGVPVAVMIRPDRLRVRRAADAMSAAERVRAMLDEAKREPLARRPALDPGRADELVAEIRQDRLRRPRRRY